MTPFRVAYVPGVTASRWARVWVERHPDVALELVATDESTALDMLGSVDVLFVRLPVDDARVAVIPLYSERAFVVVARGHLVEAADEVMLADLAGENLLDGTPEDAVALAAANAGVAIMPQSLARLHARKDVVARPVVDGPGSQVALVWLEDATTDRIDDFIGIVRGRTAHSSRGEPTPPTVVAPRRPAAKRAAPKRQPRKRRQSR